MMSRAMVVLPDDSGPNNSMMRPLGVPPHCIKYQSHVGKFMLHAGTGTPASAPRRMSEFVVLNSALSCAPRASRTRSLASIVLGASLGSSLVLTLLPVPELRFPVAAVGAGLGCPEGS